MAPTSPRSPQYHMMPPIPLLVPEYLEYLLAPNTLLTPPTPPDTTQWPPTPPRSPPIPLMPPIPLLVPQYLELLLVQNGHCSSLLKFHIFSLRVNLSSSLPPQLKLSLTVDDVYMCSMRAHLKQSVE